MPQVDYDEARERLETEFGDVERAALQGNRMSIGDALEPHFDRIFESRTQAYREVLLGCVLARLQDSSIDVHKPYVSHGDNAYSGRQLDERAVNPFLKDHNIPSSGGPFLSAFRRSVGFVPSTREGLRDTEGFDSLLALVDYLAEEDDETALTEFLRCLFIVIRDWIRMVLATIGKAGRDAFCRNLTDALDHRDVPPTLKVAWNDQIAALTTS